MLNNPMMNQNIQLEDTISGQDVSGNEIIIVKMLCNISTNRSANFSYDIYNYELFNANLEVCKQRITTFKAYCEQKANENGTELF